MAKVLARLRVQLAEQREIGVDFDTAWTGALAGVSSKWRPALEETRDAWAAAFTGAPAAEAGAALHLLIVVRERAREAADEPQQRLRARGRRQAPVEMQLVA